uniref:Si:ch211-241f5.3 n=1 Tax=Cyclopterus lumpus TaxID=8103 RepID=A0A8C3AMM8_CYCLU
SACFSALYLSLIMGLSNQSCPKGFNVVKRTCVDDDECAVDEYEDEYPDAVGPCGENADCHNTVGSFHCRCADGFTSSTGALDFTAATSATCRDVNECLEVKDICGLNAQCFNTIPLYACICDNGFISTTGVERFHHGDNVTCRGEMLIMVQRWFPLSVILRCLLPARVDIDECLEENACDQNAACVNTPGSFHCVCNAGFGLKSGRSNFSGSQEQCEESENPTELDGEDMLKVFLHELIEMRIDSVPQNKHRSKTFRCLCTAMQTVYLLSSGALNDNRKVSSFLNVVENMLRLIGAFIKPPGTTRSSTHTGTKTIRSRADLPKGAVTLSSKQAQLDIQLETAAGDLSYYPGFTTVSLLSYANLEDSTNGFFGGMKPQVNQSFELNSKVVTVSVSNRNTSHLQEPVTLTFYHLKQTNESDPTCVFWDASEEGGSWSPRGCKVVETQPEYTVCSCNHLSSFAVLMALYDIEDTFELQLITQVGMSLSLMCLFLCILTFSMIRSIKSPRTTIHLHLCISLFISTVIFLAGISRTESRVGCAVVAGLLHFFFLAVFCWMCLEGIQLFRMVVLVFNTNFKTLYMMAGGYGVPAVIVTCSALANASGYGTKRHCWLNLDLIWSFFGPACIIIIVNVFFFLITVWKLAQKFSSLNPDLDDLQKIKAFTITAMAQLTLLGTMWIFGCFQFQEGTIIMSYLFTLFGSFNGVMIFVMHCLFSKQVREEYGHILSRFCAPWKKSYSSFSYSHTSKAHVSSYSYFTAMSLIQVE